MGQQPFALDTIQGQRDRASRGRVAELVIEQRNPVGDEDCDAREHGCVVAFVAYNVCPCS